MEQVGDDNVPGGNDAHRWLVGGLCVVQVRGQAGLLAVFTQHNPGCYTGIDLVEKLTRTATPAVLAAA